MATPEQHDKTHAPCGSWPSPLTAERIVSDSVSLGEPMIDASGRYWLEGRPAEGGRQVLMRQSPDGATHELTPPPHNVRSRVHEYGGGAYTVSHGTVFFIDADGGLYQIPQRGGPELLARIDGLRFVNPVHDAGRQQIYCVCEDHRQDGVEPRNTIVAIDLEQPGSEPVTLATGEDFYASLSLDPDASQLAYLSWNHPDMPWDRTRLWVMTLGDRQAQCLIDDEESVFQPQWSPDGVLYFATDREQGWWNLHRWQDGTIENLCPFEAEFGLPQWVFGMSVFGFLSTDQVLCTYTRVGRWQLALLCTRTGELQTLRTPYSYITSVQCRPGQGVFLASSPTTLPVLAAWDAATRQLTPFAFSGQLELDPGDIATAEAIDYPTADGSTVHGFYYPPAHSRYRPLPGELPPLIVIGHGGPTAATSDAYNVKVQYWTTRGFAVLDVNYRGSTGYGRAYRQALNGLWGVADVEDCVAGAHTLAERQLVDAERLIIRGSSAGGYTTLCALAFYDVFKAGASLYGIGDLEALVRDTHKFESRYLDRLVGPYPQQQAVYRQRSPIHHIDGLNCPVIFLQGMQDKVVPPEQAEAMVAALKAKGINVAYVRFEDEQHGFRNGDNIKRAFECELAFYGRIFGFVPADAVPAIAFE